MLPRQVTQGKKENTLTMIDLALYKEHMKTQRVDAGREIITKQGVGVSSVTEYLV